MNLQKHVAGFALFFIIVGSAIFINAYLRLLTIKPDPVLIRGTIPQVYPPSSQTISFKVRQVSLDLINNKSYTELRLERQPGQDIPENLWVTTVFFTPDDLRVVGVSREEIHQSFAQSNYVLTDSSGSLTARNTPRTELFAQVYVSPYPSNNPNYPDRANLASATPVVIQWPNEKGQSATVKKFID